jgi:tRNA 2-selenouridine synthase
MGPSLETLRVPVLGTVELDRLEDAVVVDLRSPGEFAVDHVPGACNVPLFDDVERAIIGTLYARESPQAAFEEARERTLERIESLAAEIAARVGWRVPALGLRERVRTLCAGGIERLERELQAEPLAVVPRAPVVLHCWRGGLRSRSVIAFLRGLGLERAVGLAGGYKAYRRAVIERLASWSAPPTFVLRGLTGVGKTLVLREIERLRPGWTLDLERLAGHRSSILGMVGLEPCTQKTFESRLVERLGRLSGSVLVIEGESRKVGDAILPARVWRALEQGVDLELRAPLERRVAVLIEDYLGAPENRAELARRLPFLEERLGRRFTGELVALLEQGREAELVELLLERYYDPLYGHSERAHDYRASFDATRPREAAGTIVRWIEAYPGG